MTSCSSPARVTTAKARPAIVVQADYLVDGLDSLTVCPLTSDVLNLDFVRVPVEPFRRKRAEASIDMMVDKLQTYPKRRCSDRSLA